MKKCAHCLILPPMNGAGSLCGACWLTAKNEYNGRGHSTLSDCSCWLSHYDAAMLGEWRAAMV